VLTDTAHTSLLGKEKPNRCNSDQWLWIVKNG